MMQALTDGNNLVEIGDICNGDNPFGRHNRFQAQGWWVQCEYSRARRTCVSDL